MPNIPEHPRVSDALARAVLYALLDDARIGIALVRAADWQHVMTSATYERLVGAVGVLGRPLSEALPEAIAPRALLAEVVATGKTVRALEVRLRTDTVDGVRVPVHASFTFMRVRRVTADSDGVLVLVEDASEQVHERRVGELFVALANDMSAERDEAATIRSSVVHAATALGADAASIFLLSPDGKYLHGALVGWDWTRTSFGAELGSWPAVQQAIAANRCALLTAATARLAEGGWFERRGITSAICAPMAAHGRVLGVLFFDYVSVVEPQVDLDVAKQIADQCALLVERTAARTRTSGAFTSAPPGAHA